MYCCEICDANVMTLFGPGKETMIVCAVCMEESRKIDGTLKSAFNKIMKIRNVKNDLYKVHRELIGIFYGSE